MPDEDPGDVFLRHRGAVVEALLSDPSFEPVRGSGAGTPVAPAEPEGGMPAELPGVREEGGRRASKGPKASERIIALLNGEAHDPGSGLDFTAEFATASAPSQAPAEPADPGSGAAGQRNPSAAQRLAPLAETVRRLADRARKPKVLGLICVGVAILLVLALMTSGGAEDERRTLEIATATAAPSTTPPPTSAATSATTLIKAESATANCPPGGTPGMDAFSGQPGKAWSCARAFKVDGQILTIDLGQTYQIDSIGIVPGWDSVGADGTDQWARYRTVSRVSYRFDDPNATTYTQQTLDQRTLVVTTFETPVTASKVVLTVQESKGGPGINIVAISSIVITGH
ncbi:discoidin domain-containing protein [Nocardia sp. NPDC127579]|uniref:discoidin domain-containing protein n=1 Tax=Nocardia sp. NPDC127579 TaxID=3345402 RepID=UPI00362C2B19